MHKWAFFAQPKARSNSQTLSTLAQFKEHKRRLTKPADFTMSVQPPKKPFITNPPRTVLTSGMPLCFAYAANCFTNTLAQEANMTCLCQWHSLITPSLYLQKIQRRKYIPQCIPHLQKIRPELHSTTTNLDIARFLQYFVSTCKHIAHTPLAVLSIPSRPQQQNDLLR